MTILKQTTLTEEQTTQIRALEQLCKSYDGLKSSLYLSGEINFDKNMNCFFLLYDENVLVSFLTIFCPTKCEAELSALTKPAYRNMGCFNQLYTATKAELKHADVNEILFVHEPQSLEAKAVLNKLPINYDFSEYVMDYVGGAITVPNQELSLLPVNQSDRDAIVSLSTSSFEGESVDVARHWFDSRFSSKTSTIYKAIANGTIVGTLCVNFEEEPNSIFGLSIGREYRGNGYGKQMLLTILSILKKDNKAICLEVNSTNDVAFAMYKKYGFTIRAQNDYYRYQF
ncbi:MAG: GNAT family N-acetyltransferase [Oscillospiraceae bacterium]